MVSTNAVVQGTEIYSRNKFPLHCVYIVLGLYRVVLVENIPEDIAISHEGNTSLAKGLRHLLDLAEKSVEIVSPWWDLNSTEQDSRFSQAKEVRLHLMYYL